MKLAIIGSGELGQEIYELALEDRCAGAWEEIFFVDIRNENNQDVVLEDEFIRDCDKQTVEVIIAMGEPAMREKMRIKYTDLGYRFATLIHASAWISPSATIKPGTVIFPFVYVAHGTTIGENALVHTHAVIENDCYIERDTFVSYGSVTGAKTRIGQASFIGPNATIRDGISIGEQAIIGMGSVVVKDIEPRVVGVGNPCSKLRENLTRKVFK